MLKSVIYNRIEESQKGIELIQAQLIVGLANQLNSTNVGCVTKIGHVPITEIIDIIKNEVNEDFNCILTANKDTISSNLRDVFEFVKLCENNGIDIYTLHDGNLTSTFKSLSAIIKEGNSKEISEKTTNRMSKLAQQGKYLGGKLPFGYVKTIQNTLAINEKEAHVVKEIFNYYVDGLGFNTISRILQDKYGLSYGSSRWRREKLIYILTNSIYIGLPAWGKSEQKEGQFQKKPRSEWITVKNCIDSLIIIDKEIWDKTQSKLIENGFISK